MKFTQDINLLYSKCCEKFMCKNLNIREIQCFVIPLTLAVFFFVFVSEFGTVLPQSECGILKTMKENP